MKILIVSATSIEVEPLVKQLKFEKSINSAMSSYFYHNIEIDVLITGVGMVSTAYWLGKTLSFYNYEIAINVGIAGSFDKSLTLGTVVNIVNDRFSELGAESGEYLLSLIDIKLIEKSVFPFVNCELINDTDINSELLNSIPKFKGITVNTIHGTTKSIKKIRELFNPVTESMEGAAFLYACLTEKVKCLQLRGISNYVEERNKKNWNIPLAIQNVNEFLINLLNE
ncbi:MAG: futalosine hydrolase [Bacteroidales bacterium]|nr:futalosine hydrolase [Bacteroidales bacterium]